MRDIMKDKCDVCDEDGRMNGEWRCAFTGCVTYVDQLERVLRYAQAVKRGPLDSPGLQMEIEKAIAMGKAYGRPFDWGVKT